MLSLLITLVAGLVMGVVVVGYATDIPVTWSELRNASAWMLLVYVAAVMYRFTVRRGDGD